MKLQGGEKLAAIFLPRLRPNQVANLKTHIEHTVLGISIQPYTPLSYLLSSLIRQDNWGFLKGKLIESERDFFHVKQIGNT